MTPAPLAHALRHALSPGRAGESATDRQILERFVSRRDEAAFAEAVRRHGGLVLGLCRRMLPTTHDAEDAFQATFLVLARRAGSIRKRASLPSWLYGVAYRVSRRLRADLKRRAAVAVRPEDFSRPDTTAEVSWREARAVLDEELSRLPERYRLPLILCYLEGLTRDEAAARLGWGLGTFRGRLERGRDRLRARLVRRGVTLSAALPASLLAADRAAAVPPALAGAAVQAAISPGAAAPGIDALAAGAARAMAARRLAGAAAWFLAVALVGVGAAGLARQNFAAGQGEQETPAPPADKRPAVADAARKKLAPGVRELVEASDRIVIGRLGREEGRGEYTIHVAKTLKGPIYSTEKGGLALRPVKRLPPGTSGDKQYVFLLRSEEDGAGTTFASPAADTGWLLPGDANTERLVRQAIPLPREWSKPVGGVQLGLRLRRARVKPGEEVVAEVCLRNAGEPKATVAQHRMNAYDYWPQTRFFVKRGKETYELAKPDGPMNDLDAPALRDLGPGETYVHAVRLRKWPVARGDVQQVAADAFAEPGEYEVSCTYLPSTPDGGARLVRMSAPPVKLIVEKDGLGEARLRGVRENLDRLQLLFSVRPAEAADRPDRRYELRYVALGVNAIPREPHATWPDGKPIGADPRVTAVEAGKIVDVLARMKFFDQAVTPLGKEVEVKPPSLSISVSYSGTNVPTQYRLTMPLDLFAVQQLQDIRRWVGDGAGKLLDRFRQPMEKDVNAAP